MMICGMEWLQSPFLDIGIRLAELVLAVITVILGSKKVGDFFDEYRERRRSAAFGFYVNLGYYVKRLRTLVFSDSGKPIMSLYLLSPSEEIQKKANGYESLGQLLSTTAYECLRYLSTESNQVPPFQEESKRRDWRKQLDKLVEYLNQFCMIGKKVYFPVLGTEEGITTYCNEIQVTLDDIEHCIEEAVEQIYDNKNK